jgi:hypothetical protein
MLAKTKNAGLFREPAFESSFYGDLFQIAFSSLLCSLAIRPNGFGSEVYSSSVHSKVPPERFAIVPPYFKCGKGFKLYLLQNTF